MKRTLPINLKSLLLVLSLLMTFTAFAQEIEVTGKVTDEIGPLPGVNIQIKGTNSGTATDMDGNYAFKVKIGDVLVFSAISFVTKEKIVKDSIVNVILKVQSIYCGPSIQINCILIEAVNKVTGSFSKVNKEDFSIGNIYHPYQLIRGRVSGLTISKPGGDPLGTFDVYQRGQHSILGSTDPLIVIDGLPGASLQIIDPQDIESVTVLRDASMTALYGTRGANGVVIIETKKAYYGRKFKVSYSGYASLEQVAKTPDVLDAAQFRSLVTDANSRYYNPAANFGTSTDWAEEITRTGLSQAHNLSFSGRMKSTDYRLSLNYRKVNGVAKSSGFDQTNALLNVSQDLFKNKVRLTANAAITHRNFTDIDKDIFYYAAVFNPTAPIRTDTSSYGGYFQQPLFDYINPVSLLEQIDNQGEQTIYTTNLNARWEIINNLRAQVQYGFQQQDYARQYRVNPDTYTRYFNYQTKFDLSNQSFQTSLLYDGYFERQSFQLAGGYQYQEWRNESYNDDFNPQSDSAAIFYKTNTRLAAFFGRVRYDFDEWLVVNANWRHEGSTRFGENNKWGNFYGFGASVNFAELLELSFTDYLRARISYGVAGNLPVDGVYSDLTLRPSGYTLYNGNFINIYSPATNANPNLKWEKRREWNVGLSFTLFNGKLAGEIDWYRGKSVDFISAYYTFASPNLASTTYENFIDFENRGVEINLGTQGINIGKLAWNASVNFAIDRPKLNNASPTNGMEIKEISNQGYYGVPGLCCFQPIQIRTGEPLGQFVGPEFDRFEAGQVVYKDQNGDDQIGLEDNVVLGNALPDFTFGIKNEFNWNKLEFSFFLRGVIGHSILNTHAMIFGFGGILPTYNVLETAVEGAQSPILYGPRFSSYHVENASFATLENLVIGYNFNPRKGYLSALKVYAAAQNLFTLSSYSGVDPEVRFKNRVGNSYRANTLVPGLDARIGYYSTRTFTLGVQAEF